MLWMKNPKYSDEDARKLMGILPGFLVEADERPAITQFDESYQHGGGWRNCGVGKWKLDRANMALKYPGDPAMKPVAWAPFHEKETVIIYPHGYVCVIKEDGNFEVCRMD